MAGREGTPLPLASFAKRLGCTCRSFNIRTASALPRRSLSAVRVTDIARGRAVLRATTRRTRTQSLCRVSRPVPLAPLVAVSLCPLMRCRSSPPCRSLTAYRRTSRITIAPKGRNTQIRRRTRISSSRDECCALTSLSTLARPLTLVTRPLVRLK